jgi:hypothetical protein
MDFIDLESHLSNGKILEKHDYIYEHTIEGYPLRADYDTKNLYLISDINDNIIDALGVTTGLKTQLSINNMTNNWWVLPIPNFVKNMMF